MATITAPTLVVANVNATTVSLTVSYTLTPSAIEVLAGTVFSEGVQLFGDDALIDPILVPFPVQVFVAPAAVPRIRTRNVLKSVLNEDAGFEATGAELADEVYARVTITYAASPPVVPTLPASRISNLVTGAWK